MKMVCLPELTTCIVRPFEFFAQAVKTHPEDSLSVAVHQPPCDYRALATVRGRSGVGSATLSRSASASRLGGAPNIRRYSRLNCEGLSYPTAKPTPATSSRS